MNEILRNVMQILCGRHNQHDQDLTTLLHEVRSLTHEVKKVMATQAELASSLTALGTTLSGFKTELSNDIANLQTALNTQGATTPEVDAAMAALTSRVTDLGTTIQGVDALAPGTPAAPTDPAPTA